jgi:hypothetical protein
VFCDELGRALIPNRVSLVFLRLRKATGIPIGSIRCLRHASATLALLGRVPMHVVAARLGDDPKTVLASYAKLQATSDGEAAATIAATTSVDGSWTSSAPAESQTLD